MSSQLANKHILDTSAWNALFDDEKREDLVKILRRKVILPTSVAITELAAIEDSARRISILQLVKVLGRDNRPLATPNEIIIMACQGYSRRDAQITLNAGNDAEGAWIALNKPELVDDAAQRFSACEKSPASAWQN
jgi:predicted nucleic acid-binding protein